MSGKLNLTESEIEEMCEGVISVVNQGGDLVEYVKGFIAECQGKNKYFCQCDAGCGNWFEECEIGTKCGECGDGTMQPQDVEPWGDE